MNLTCIKTQALLLMLLSGASCCVYAQGTSEADAGTNDEDIFGLGWLAQTQEYSSNRADALAEQLDRFFGVARSDLEAAYSSLRLIPEFRVNSKGDNDTRLRLRGRFHLPRLDERISLIFSEDKGEGTGDYRQNDVFTETQSTRVNMEINLRNQQRHRLDFRLGLRSNLKLRTGLRYRYEAPWSSNLSNRLTETLYFIDGKGTGSFTQYQLDYSLNSSKLLRWSSEYRYENDLPGNEWSTSLEHLSRFSNDGGLGIYMRVASTTGQSWISTYQTGIRLRRNIAYPWLFWEFSPGYQWLRPAADLSREGSLFAVFRLEMAIGRQ